MVFDTSRWAYNLKKSLVGLLVIWLFLLGVTDVLACVGAMTHKYTDLSGYGWLLIFNWITIFPIAREFRLYRKNEM